MKWNNKTPLEELALICSEVGEACNECRGDRPTEHLAEELADIVLRVLSMASGQGIQLGSVIVAKIEKNELRGNRGRIK